MPGVRLPLQLGRAALAQGTRFAAFVWLGPVLLILAAMFHTLLADFVLGLGGVIAVMFAVDAAGTSKKDRPTDMVLDAGGFTIAGGPLDGKRFAWSDVDASGCRVVDGESRIAIRWWIASLLTAHRIDAIERRVDVPVYRLVLARPREKDLELAEAEGDEREALVQLRDSIVGAAAPPDDAPPAALPQEILKCPHCDGVLVPVAAPTMACTWCHHDLVVPAELQQRVRASAVLDETSGMRGRLVRKLVDQPSGRRAGWVVAGCRRLMIWIQPAAIVLLVAMLYHATHGHTDIDGFGVARVAPDDDGVFFYDIRLLVLVIVAAFGIAWSVGLSYVSNRQGLRVLADHFGAVPPAKPGAPSTCHQCGAPLPATSGVLVHCVYCSAENVLGVDPRPAALRRRRERFDLARGLRRRLHARVATAVVVPLAIVLGAVTVREVWIAWHVDELTSLSDPMCVGHCGTVENADPIRRTVTFEKAGHRVMSTLLPHGKLTFGCFSECSFVVGGVRITPPDNASTPYRIENGVLRAL